MTDKKMKTHLDALPIPYPYLVSATDQYYGVTPCYEEKQSRKKKKKERKSTHDRDKTQEVTDFNHDILGLSCCRRTTKLYIDA